MWLYDVADSAAEYASSRPMAVRPVGRANLVRIPFRKQGRDSPHAEHDDEDRRRHREEEPVVMEVHVERHLQQQRPRRACPEDEPDRSRRIHPSSTDEVDDRDGGERDEHRERTSDTGEIMRHPCPDDGDRRQHHSSA
jgi:hypothetical protein